MELSVAYLCEKLGKLPHEIRELPMSDFRVLIEYFQVQKEEADKDRARAKREAKKKPASAPTKMGSKKR